MYAEGTAHQIWLMEQHQTLASMLEDLFDAAEFGNHIVTPDGIHALAEGLCEVLYPELSEEERAPDPTDIKRAAVLIHHMIGAAEKAVKAVRG